MIVYVLCALPRSKNSGDCVVGKALSQLAHASYAALWPQTLILLPGPEDTVSAVLCVSSG